MKHAIGYILNGVAIATVATIFFLFGIAFLVTGIVGVVNNPEKALLGVSAFVVVSIIYSGVTGFRDFKAMNKQSEKETTTNDQ